MTDYSKITALYSRLSVGDEDRDGGESNSIQNQKIFLENYARGQHLTNIRHYIDDDESGRFFDRSAYSRMMDDVENGKIGVCIMKDLTRWGRDYLQVGNAMEIFRRNNVRFIAVNNGIDSEKPDTFLYHGFSSLSTPWFFQIPVCVGVVSTNHLLGNFPAVLRKVTLEECSGCLKKAGYSADRWQPCRPVHPG